MLLDIPHRKEPSVKSPIAVANTRRVPKRSATHPLNREEDGETQGIAGEHSLHAQRTDVECSGDRRYCRIQNGGVQRLHEEGNRNKPWQ
jgi:hypothetical protein